MNDFTLSVSVASSYVETVGRVRERLAEAGFGVLNEIDLAATLHAKLGVEIEPRIILGACRPALAHQALELDPRVATLLPCTVVVGAADGGATVEVFDPAVMTEFSPALSEVAAEARTRLSEMMSALTRDVAGDAAGDVEDSDAARA